MKIKCFLIAFVLFTASCKKDTIVEPETEGNQYEIVNINTVSKVDVGLRKSEIQNANFSLLGYGFDAKENTIYINNGLRGAVINMETIPSGRYDILKAATVRSFSSNQLSKAEVLSLFKLNNTYAVKSSYLGYDFQKILPSNNISFTKQMVIDRIIRLYGSRLNSENYNQDFNNAILNLSPEEIVKKFGTHIISDFYQGFFYMLVSYVDKETRTDKTITRNRQHLIFAAGSDVSKIVVTGDTISLTDYSKSYTPDNSQFVGFSDGSQQTPLYELLEKGEKRDALKNYIEAYLK